MGFWGDLGETVADAAPLLGSALGGPAGGAAGKLVASLFGADPNDPEAVRKAIEADPESAIKLRQLENDHQTELRRMTLEAETSRLSEINKTMRAELDADGLYKSGWRPLFGYGAAVAWMAQTGAIVYSIVWQPENAGEIMQALGELTGMWSVALAVLGVSVTQRSKDKQTKAGIQPKGMMGKIKDLMK